MKHISTLLIFICCFFKTYHSVAQADTTYNINEMEVMIIKDNQRFLIVYDTFSYMNPVSSISFYHYDSLNRLILDSILYEKSGNREYFHYVDGEIKLKYTYYNDKDINVYHTESQNDSVAIFNTVRFKNNDTIVQRDTIFLYYPYSCTVEYYENNITLEALGEKIYSSDTSDNKMRIYMLHFRDTTFSIVLYTISDIFKKSLQVTKKTGDCLFTSYFVSKEEQIKKYVYESTNKTISNKKIKKTLKKIISLKSLPVRNADPDFDPDFHFDNLLVEYVVNGKYYHFVSSYNFCYSRTWEFPSEERKVLEMIIKLVTYLDESFK